MFPFCCLDFKSHTRRLAQNVCARRSVQPGHSCKSFDAISTAQEAQTFVRFVFLYFLVGGKEAGFFIHFIKTEREVILKDDSFVQTALERDSNPQPQVPLPGTSSPQGIRPRPQAVRCGRRLGGVRCTHGPVSYIELKTGKPAMQIC